MELDPELEDYPGNALGGHARPAADEVVISSNASEVTDNDSDGEREASVQDADEVADFTGQFATCHMKNRVRRDLWMFSWPLLEVMMTDPHTDSQDTDWD